MMTDLNVDSSLQGAIQNINSTLRPLLFESLNKSGRPSASSLVRENLLQLGANLCRLGGLLIQAYCVLLEDKKCDEEIIPELKDAMKPLWHGIHAYDEGLAISILHQASLSPETSSIKRLIGSPDIFVDWQNLLDYRQMGFKEYSTKYRDVDWSERICKLIKALTPLLHDCRFAGNHFEFSAEKAPCFPFIYFSHAEGAWFYLWSFKRLESSTCIAFVYPHGTLQEMWEPQGGGDLVYQYEISRKLLDLAPPEDRIVTLFGSQYRYLATLAKVIAKTPGKAANEAREELLRNLGRDQHLPKDKVDAITLLLADRGPTDVLSHSLRKNTALYYDYLKMLEKYGYGSAEAGQRMFKSEMAQRERIISQCLDLDKEYESTVRAEIELELKAWAVMRASGLEVDSPHPYIESIDMRLTMCKRWASMFYGNSLDVPAVATKIGKMVERTFRFLYCFYQGLAAYHQSKRENSADYEDQERDLLVAAARAHRSLIGVPTGGLIDRLTALINARDQAHVSELLGRDEICPPDAFCKIVTEQWRDLFIRIKHDMGNEVTPDETFKFLANTIALFELFRKGRERAFITDTLPLEPVYPHVISFREVRRKRDGLIIHSHEIYSSAQKSGEQRPRIGILSQNDYKPHEEYYCIPMLKRATRRWWLNPFLIRCSEFNKCVPLYDSPGGRK